jgi:phage-related protein
MKPVFWMGSSKGDLITFPDEVRREIGYQLEHVQEGLDTDDRKPMPNGRGARNSRLGVVRSLPVYLSGNAAGGNLRLALFSKKTQKTRQQDLDLAHKRFKSIQVKS